MPPIYPQKRPSYPLKNKVEETRMSKGETIRAAAQRSLFENSTFKRFNSSNGVRQSNKVAQEMYDDEEEKL